MAELYAPFSSVELHAIEAAGLCPKGESFRRIADGEFALGAGGPVVNPSGGICAPTRSPSPGWSGRLRSPCRSPPAGARRITGASVGVATAIGGDHQFYASMVLANHLEEIA